MKKIRLAVALAMVITTLALSGCATYEGYHHGGYPWWHYRH